MSACMKGSCAGVRQSHTPRPKRAAIAKEHTADGLRFSVKRCQAADLQLGKRLGCGSSGALVLEGTVAGQTAAVKLWDLHKESANASSPADGDAPVLASFLRQPDADPRFCKVYAMAALAHAPAVDEQWSLLC